MSLCNELIFFFTEWGWTHESDERRERYNANFFKMLAIISLFSQLQFSKIYTIVYVKFVFVYST